LIFPVLAFCLVWTACTALRTVDGASPEEVKKSELSKDDLWDQVKTLEKEKAVCQKQVADQAGALALMKSLHYDQQNDLAMANQIISELKQVIDDLNARLKELRETARKETPAEWSHGAFAKAWGTIMYAKSKTNIRTKRSVDSMLRGSLMPGQTVKADLLKDGWYAVFKITETDRSEKNALGYVHAPRLLGILPPEMAPEARKQEEPSGAYKKVKEIFSVAVKSIRHRVQPGGNEVLLVEFDRFYVPAVYNIDGDAPMIIMDVTRTSSMKKEWSEIRTDGKLIRKIRVTPNPEAGILRIVMNMTPDKDYDIKPTFYTGSDSKVYALEVTGVTPEK